MPPMAGTSRGGRRGGGEGGRWNARLETRRAERAARKDRGDTLPWWEVLHVPLGELDAAKAVVLAIAALVVLVVLLAFSGPFLWILILFVVDLVLWILLAVAGVAAWLLGRPWEVVVIDSDNATVASARVRGRRGAREHAEIVRARIAHGMSPVSAVRLP